MPSGITLLKKKQYRMSALLKCHPEKENMSPNKIAALLKCPPEKKTGRQEKTAALLKCSHVKEVALLYLPSCNQGGRDHVFLSWGIRAFCDLYRCFFFQEKCHNENCFRYFSKIPTYLWFSHVIPWKNIFISWKILFCHVYIGYIPVGENSIFTHFRGFHYYAILFFFFEDIFL